MSMPAAFTIRPAAQNDADALGRLMQEELRVQEEFAGGAVGARPDFDWSSYLRRKLDAQARGGTTAVLLVADSGTGLAGYIEVTVSGGGGDRPSGRRGRLLPFAGAARARPENQSPLRDTRRGLIQDIFVAGADRRKGVGTALLKAGLEWLVQAGATEVLASIWDRNDASREFFASHGFAASRVVMRAPL
jgi:GNAT superfamily N-acetyltransferase